MLSMAGCATMINGTSQRIQVLSEPPGAEVFVAGEPAGTTPTEFVMTRRAASPQVRVVDQQGNSEYRQLGNSLSKWMWLDLVAAFFLGYGVYPQFPGEEDPEGSIRMGLLAALIPAAADFTLGGAPYQILNGGPEVAQSAAVSISVVTEDQAETDRLWDALTADGGQEGRCAWLTDRWGVSWQIVPRVLIESLISEDRAGAERAFQAMLTMNKVDVAGIEAAFRGD